MIVETDFLDHWKTQMLIGVLDDPASPCYLLRLWAHCQQRKEYQFDSAKLTPAILKAITRCPADKQVLWNAFVEVGFLDLHEDGTVEAHGFYDSNSQLIAKWINGQKGGRPKKKTATEKPNQNLNVTEPEPIEEREREEEKEKVEKQDEGEGGNESSFSPSSCEKSFWKGKSYADLPRRTIEDYGDLHAMDDPIEAAMAVTGDYSMGMYGFLVKGCDKCLNAGMTPGGISGWLFQEVEKVFGEIKAGERERGKPAASGFTARMQENFATIDQPKTKAA
ncbi:MAG: hypothetical protein V3V05_07330 [Pontiella sp.]